MVSPALEIFGMEMPRLARRAARESGIKLMVHIGDTEKRYDPTVIRRLLPLLEEGDILTHYFTANPGRGAGRQRAPGARGLGGGKNRGLVRHRSRADEFQLRRRAAGLSIRDCCPTASAPTSPCPAALRTVHSMTEMMTRFLGLGFTLEQVVTMCTANPGQGYRRGGPAREPRGRAPGRRFSVLRVEDGDWTVYDVLGESLHVSQAVMPVLTVKRGEVFRAEWGPRPWGWEPDPGPSGAAFKGCC